MNETEIMKPVFLINILLYHGDIIGKSRLQDALMHFEEDYVNEFGPMDFEFKDGKFSLYSPKILEALQFLENNEFITSKKENCKDHTRYRYSITAKGREIIDTTDKWWGKKQMDPGKWELIREFYNEYFGGKK